MDLRAGLDGCGKSRLTNGIRSPDLQARRESLYPLSYTGPLHYRWVAWLLPDVSKRLTSLFVEGLGVLFEILYKRMRPIQKLTALRTMSRNK